MSNTPFIPALPLNGDGEGDEPEEIATREVDGETKLDPDASDDLIDSAEADRIAAEGDDGA